MLKSKFTNGTYKCNCCNRMTRTVIGDEYLVSLCRQCYDLAGFENTLVDCPEVVGIPEIEIILARIAFLKFNEKCPNPNVWDQMLREVIDICDQRAREEN